jgi:hypothetical protein
VSTTLAFMKVGCNKSDIHAHTSARTLTLDPSPSVSRPQTVAPLHTTGAFDSASTAVVRGVVQTDQETIMYGWGSQYTHGGCVHGSLDFRTQGTPNVYGHRGD